MVCGIGDCTGTMIFLLFRKKFSSIQLRIRILADTSTQTLIETLILYFRHLRILNGIYINIMPNQGPNTTKIIIIHLTSNNKLVLRLVTSKAQR